MFGRINSYLGRMKDGETEKCVNQAFFLTKNGPAYIHMYVCVCSKKLFGLPCKVWAFLMLFFWLLTMMAGANRAQ